MAHGSYGFDRRRGGEIDDAVLTITEQDAARIEYPLNRGIFKLLFFGGAIALFVLFGRAGYMATIQGDEFLERSRSNSVREFALVAPRGIIRDRSGTPLVRNVPMVDLVFVPADGPRDDAEKRKLVDRLKSGFTIEDDVADRIYSLSGTLSMVPIPVQENVPQDAVISLLSNTREFPGVLIVATARREYIDGLIFAHVLGYEGIIDEAEYDAMRGDGYIPTDSVGKQGIEKTYESVLRGDHGFRRVEVDAFGRPKKILGTQEPTVGSDLYLNIDAELQKDAYDALAGFLETNGLKRGAVVALDPRDGGVRALVSYPSYDNNLFAEGISSEEYSALVGDESKPLFDRVISGSYPPGSTFKPVVAAAALSEGVVDERTQIESRGGISVGSYFFGDWKVHGFTDMRRAIAVSSDVYFYSVGGGYGSIPGLGIRRIKEYAARFGYGDVLGIDLPGEVPGFLPDPDWKEDRFGERWYIGDDYHAAIGQGYILATPLQIASSVAAIANGGALYVPRLASMSRDPDGATHTFPARIIREQVADPYILSVVREGMRETVTEGTAQSLNALPYPVAGKTGTAQYGTGDLTHGWFVSFAPYDDPEIAMVVLVEGQETETYNAVPIAQEIYSRHFERMKESGHLSP